MSVPIAVARVAGSRYPSMTWRRYCRGQRSYSLAREADRAGSHERGPGRGAITSVMGDTLPRRTRVCGAISGAIAANTAPHGRVRRRNGGPAPTR